MEQILLMENITKIYPNGFVANKGVNLACEKGTIHALLGENGAGKTTLMKILFGFITPEEGRILVKGEPISFKDPLDAIRHGVGMVHQHFMLVDELTVAENVVLGEEPRRFGLFDKKKAAEITAQIAEKYNFKLDPYALVGDCSVGVKQKIEILKALLRGAEILILDEPTAVLTPQETAELFVELKKLRQAGHTILFISHKLNEVKELCDDFTILRSGRTVAVGKVAEYSEQQLSNLMVGREISLEIRKDNNSNRTKERELVRVEHLNCYNAARKKVLNDVSFSLCGGNILGVAGVEGNGQSELSELLTGMRQIENGSITIYGESIAGKKVRQIRQLGVSSISEDRMIYGCAPAMSVRENLIADRYFAPGYSKGMQMNTKAINREVERLMKEFKIECPSPDTPVGMLSGGNIQKLIAAREFTSGAKVIVANQPTRGIDVGSTEFIRNQLVEISRKQEACVLLISADLSEILEVSDSIIVICGGEIVAYFEDASTVNEFEIGEYMLGIRKMTPQQIGGALA